MLSLPKHIQEETERQFEVVGDLHGSSDGNGIAGGRRMGCIASHEVTALFGDLRALKDKLVNALGMANSPEEATMKLEQAIKSKEAKRRSDDLSNQTPF